MSYLSRRERDAAVGLATVFAFSFLAGFASYRIGDTVIYDYGLASGLLFWVFALYLGYRALRRAAEFGVAYFRAGDPA